MGIEFHCTHCTKLIRAPREAGGKRGKCPYCKQSVYVPTPPEDLEPLGVAPLDSNEEQSEKALADEALRVQAALAHENESPPETGREQSGAADAVGRPPGAGDVVDLESAIVRFVQAMQASRLEEADSLCAELSRRPRRAREQVQRMMVDEIPPPGLEDVPPALLKGFLRTLLERL